METLFQNQKFVWLDYLNPTPEDLKSLMETYGINKFVIADSLEVGHLPKYEHNDGLEFLLVRFYDKGKTFYNNIVRQFSNKIAIYYSDNFLITVHQHPTHFLSEVKESLNPFKDGLEAVPLKMALYKILNFTFQTYLKPANQMSEEIDRYESQIFLGNLKKFDLKKVYQIKREASSCKKVLMMMRDALSELGSYIKKSAQYQDLRELCDKMLHLHEQVLEDAQNLLNIYLSLSSQKTNEIMKLLTVFSAFFLPLTFIAGVYGMNFKFMPELGYIWGYPMVILIMLLIVIIIYIWFKRKKIL